MVIEQIYPFSTNNCIKLRIISKKSSKTQKNAKNNFKKYTYIQSKNNRKIFKTIIINNIYRDKCIYLSKIPNF